jgi:peroxiredoxin Q/BCP
VISVKIPEFRLKGIDESENEVEISSGDLKGKWAVIYFYPRDNTPGCTTEAKEFTELKEEFDKLGVQVIGISRQSVESHKRFREKHGLRITLLSDPDAEVHKAFGAWGKKKMYGKEVEGVIRSTFLIDPEGNIVKEWKNVKAKGHAAKVLEEVKRVVGEQNS